MAGKTFVHLFEWKWSDVAIECEQFLSKKKFTAVQISPPMEHIGGSQWWTRYQPVSYQLVSRSGSAAEFEDMVNRCAKVGVEIYVDAVINHMAAGQGTGIAGTQYGGRSYKDYSQSEFHHNPNDMGSNCQVNNYKDKYNVQYCDLVSLPDLCTGCDGVKNTLASYLNKLAGLGVAGYRIDAAKHQDASELQRVLQAGPSDKLIFQEVISGAGEAVRPDMYYGNGMVTEFDYANNAIGPNFLQDGKMQYLKTLGPGWGLMPSDSAVVFLDNHDTQRGGAPLTYKNGALYTLANVFMLSWPYGYPKVMSSYYFNGHDQGPPSTPVHSGNDVHCNDGSNWVCEHRRPAIANMVHWRKIAGSEAVDNWNTVSPDQVYFSRGQAFLALNRGGNNMNCEAQTNLQAGNYCNIIENDDPSTCQSFTVGSDGKVSINVNPMTAFALHSGARKN